MNKKELKEKLLEQINKSPSGHLLRDITNQKIRDATRTAGKFNNLT